LRFFSFWYVIKKTRNPAMARLVADLPPKTCDLFLNNQVECAPLGLLKERSKAKANPERI
jgi:hypothetical protein